MTESPRSLTLRLTTDRSLVELVRGMEVADDDWAALQAVFGYAGQRPEQVIVTPLVTLIGSLAALAPWPDPQGVWWEPTLRKVVERFLTTSTQVGEPHDPAVRLAGSRFTSPQPLRDFQVQDIGVLLAMPHGMNFSVPGAGKTRVTLGVYEAERHAGRVAQLLVVAPNNAWESWTSELGDVLSVPQGPGGVACVTGDWPTGPVEVCVVNYPRLSSRLVEAIAWVSARPTMVVLDEAHRAKRGTAGLWGRSCLTLAPFAERRDVLTGTPAPQGVSDLVSLLNFTHMAAGPRLLPDPTLPVPEVAERISSLFVRTNKEQLDLPEVTLDYREVPMKDLHADIYRALRGIVHARLSDSRSQANFARMGRVMFYLLMAATNPKLLRAGSDRWDPIDFRVPPLEVPAGSTLTELLDAFSDYGPPAKYEEVLSIVRANVERGRKTLVWSTFVRNLTSLDRAMAAMQPAVVHGGTPIIASDGVPSRQDEIDRFRHDPDCWVLLANPATLGEGVSLHRECQDAVYLDRSFNAGQFLQSVDRIHRLGMTEPARVTVLGSTGTVDDLVHDRLGQKVDALGQLLRDPVLHTLSLPDEETQSTLLDLDDMQALFEHLAGA